MSEQPFESILDPIFRNSKGKAVEAPALGGMVADTHCHLEMLGNPGLALARCSYHNVMLIVTVVDVCESPAVTYDNLADWEAEASGILDDWGAPTLLPLVKVVAGCHPQNADSYDSNLESVIMRCMSHPLTVAVGEIGLDYFYEGAAHSVQRDVFKRQIELAHKVEKPIVMHVRDSAGKTDAHEDALDILEEEGYPEAGALLHCFTSAPDVMQPFLDNGCYVAFGGAMTFNNGDAIRESAKLAPADRILTETDSPYMAPVPLRGTTCSPEYTVFTAQRLLEVRGLTGDDKSAFLGTIFDNAMKFYNIGKEMS